MRLQTYTFQNIEYKVLVWFEYDSSVNVAIFKHNPKAKIFKYTFITNTFRYIDLFKTVQEAVDDAVAVSLETYWTIKARKTKIKNFKKGLDN